MYNLWKSSHGKITVLTLLGGFVCGAALFASLVWSSDTAISSEPMHLSVAGEAPTLDASAYVVIALDGDTPIAAQNEDEVVPLASVTKLFTAAAFRTETDFMGTTTITWSDVNTEGRAGKLEAYQVYPYNELVYALLLESSNDAAAAIERVSPETLTRMNTFGTDTHFSDTSGLDSENTGSAKEVAELARTVYFEQPHIFAITKMHQIIGTYTGWINNNPFIDSDGYKGGKHGFTYEAGRTAVAVFSEQIDGVPTDFLYVVLGSEDLEVDMELVRTYVQNNVSYK